VRDARDLPGRSQLLREPRVGRRRRPDADPVDADDVAARPDDRSDTLAAVAGLEDDEVLRCRTARVSGRCDDRRERERERGEPAPPAHALPFRAVEGETTLRGRYVK
jgi:hypothetical protein